MRRIGTRNAAFQQWQALLSNRTKRQRAGEFLVQGVRPISLAVEHGWTVRTLLHTSGPRSRWAERMLALDVERAELAPELLSELADKDHPELVAVVALPADRLDRIPRGPDLLAVVFDRPSTPGNIGTLVRSADAFGASGVIVTGHAADPYDPRAVRASTGSLFAIPVVRVPGHREVLDWAGRQPGHREVLDRAGRQPSHREVLDRAGSQPGHREVLDRAAGQPGHPEMPDRAGVQPGHREVLDRAGVQLVGTDEHGALDVAEHDLTGPTVLLIGNETTGLSAAWREAADATVRIPISGAASSLNAAAAATVVLYEATRQRARR